MKPTAIDVLFMFVIVLGAISIQEAYKLQTITVWPMTFIGIALYIVLKKIVEFFINNYNSNPYK